MSRTEGRYRVYLIEDGQETTPLLWSEPVQPSLEAYPAARLRQVGAFASASEARLEFGRLLEASLAAV